MTVVGVRNVTRRFGSFVALDDVSFSLSGGITGLLGPNGAGKTTLLRILATVAAADAGSIELLGRDPQNAQASSISGVGSGTSHKNQGFIVSSRLSSLSIM